MRLKDKIAIVTGGGQGIGKAVCMKLADEGATVIVVDIDANRGEEVVKIINDKENEAIFVKVDLTKNYEVKDMISECETRFKKIDILVNVAGIIFPKIPLEELSEKDWDSVMDVNLKGTLLASQFVAKSMIKNGSGGIIINFASVGAHTPQVYAGAYSTSKAGVLMLTKQMAVEWAKYNIRVNSISPGPIETEMMRGVFKTEEMRNSRIKSVPMNRFGKPEEIANVVAFMASDESDYITGQSIVVDGGSLNNMFYTVGLLMR